MRSFNEARKNFSENLILFRKKLGMNLSQFSEYSDIPLAQIAAIENGITNIGYKTILKIVKVLSDFNLTFEDMLS